MWYQMYQQIRLRTSDALKELSKIWKTTLFLELYVTHTDNYPQLPASKRNPISIYIRSVKMTHVPVLSTATERTPPLWHSILTRASFWLGDQRVTVPLGWPRWMMALWGFWHITSSRPVLVQMAATSFPTDTSRYCRKLVALWGQEEEQEGLSELFTGGEFKSISRLRVFKLWGAWGRDVRQR